MDIPKWHRAEPIDLLNNHVGGEGYLTREVGDVTQVIERVSIGPAWSHPTYRLVEVKNGKPRAIRTADVNSAWTLREMRAAADRRAKRKLAAMREP